MASLQSGFGHSGGYTTYTIKAVMSYLQSVSPGKLADSVAAVVVPGLLDERPDGYRVSGLVAVRPAPLLPPELAGAGERVMPLEEVSVRRVQIRMGLDKEVDPLLKRTILHVLLSRGLDSLSGCVTVRERPADLRHIG